MKKLSFGDLLNGYEGGRLEEELHYESRAAGPYIEWRSTALARLWHRARQRDSAGETLTSISTPISLVIPLDQQIGEMGRNTDI